MKFFSQCGWCRTMPNRVQTFDKNNCKIRYRYQKNVTSLPL